MTLSICADWYGLHVRVVSIRLVMPNGSAAGEVPEQGFHSHPAAKTEQSLHKLGGYVYLSQKCGMMLLVCAEQYRLESPEDAAGCPGRILAIGAA